MQQSGWLSRVCQTGSRGLSRALQVWSLPGAPSSDGPCPTCFLFATRPRVWSLPECRGPAVWSPQCLQGQSPPQPGRERFMPSFGR